MLFLRACGPRSGPVGRAKVGGGVYKLGENLTKSGDFGTMAQNAVNIFVIFLIYLK